MGLVKFYPGDVQVKCVVADFKLVTRWRLPVRDDSRATKEGNSTTDCVLGQADPPGDIAIASRYHGSVAIVDRVSGQVKQDQQGIWPKPYPNERVRLSSRKPRCRANSVVAVPRRPPAQPQ